MSEGRVPYTIVMWKSVLVYFDNIELCLPPTKQQTKSLPLTSSDVIVERLHDSYLGL